MMLIKYILLPDKLYSKEDSLKCQIDISVLKNVKDFELNMRRYNFVAFKSNIMKEENFKVEKIKKGREDRFIVIDKETGEILDDAQGYGYKSYQKAIKGYWYKCGGKKKIDKAKSELNNWKKDNKKAACHIDSLAMDLFKEIARGETAHNELFESAEKEFGIKIPQSIRKVFFKY